jgi:subtilisin family serine protease
MMRRVVLLLTAGLLLLPAAPAAADQTTGRLLVSLDRDGSLKARAAAAGAIAARTGARRAGPVVPEIGLTTLKPPPGVSPHAFAQLLRRLPGVRAVSAERRYTLRAQPNDPAFTTMESAPGTPGDTPEEWWAQRQNMFAAWDITHGVGAKVAVIDTGVDGNHPELAGRIGETFDEDSDPSHGGPTGDEVGHGTHVASLACAAADNGIAIAGAGYGCTLIVVKSDLSDASVAASIVDAVNAGADAINMSFGTDGSSPAAQAVRDAIDFAYDKGVLMAAAAADDPVQEQGDPSNVLQPAGTGPDITQGKGLSVTAARFDDQRASFAGYGSEISIAAYGTFTQGTGGPRGILGAFPGNQTELERPSLFTPACNCRTTINGDNRYAYIQGTSMAAPMVTATGALMRHLNPDLGAADLIRIIKQTARRPAGGWTPDLGWGILDAGAAMQATRTTDKRAPSSKVRSPKTTRSTRVTLRLSGRDTAPTGCIASGLDHFEIYRAINGRKVKRIATTKRRTYRLRVSRGSRYTFYAVAVDKAGNREAVPHKPDARLRVARH